MSRLEFLIDDWIGLGDCESATLASLRIAYGSGAGLVPITENHDTFAQTVRQHINVPADPVARWLLMNWWRLRWEPARSTPSYDWRSAHCMASIGEGYAWPPVEFTSDGEFVRIHIAAEARPDVASIRYLNSLALDVPAADFESAIDRFVTLVRERLVACGCKHSDLNEMWEEVQEERADPRLSHACRLQAMAGIDPGEAADEWIAEILALQETTGPESLPEVVALLPEMGGDPDEAQRQVGSIRDATTTVDLSAVDSRPENAGFELPWQRGARFAAHLRSHANLATAPLSKKHLEDLLGAKLPLDAAGHQRLRGAYRNGRHGGRASVIVPVNRLDSQRFYLARLIGCAMLSSPQEHLLPVTDGNTAMQKFERAFAQELLCPWSALDAFTDDKGTDEDGIAAAAEYFDVSDLLIRTTLVNKKKLPREYLDIENATS